MFVNTPCIKVALRPDSARTIVTYFSAYFDVQLHCAHPRSYIFIENGHLSSKFRVIAPSTKLTCCCRHILCVENTIRKIPNMAQANPIDLFIMRGDVSF